MLILTNIKCESVEIQAVGLSQSVDVMFVNKQERQAVLSH